MAIFVLINFFREWNYSSNVILDNTDFNLVLFITIFMGILSFLLSFKITWIKSIKFILRCISRLDDSRIEDHYNKCSFSIQENQSEKKSNVLPLRRLAIQKRNARLKQNKQIRYIKSLKQEVNAQTEKVNISSDNKSSVTFYRNPTYYKPPYTAKICSDENIDCSSVNTTTRAWINSSQNCPDILVITRICGGIMFVSCTLALAISPILINHMMKPESPFIYYKPGCPRLNNHTQIIKVMCENFNPVLDFYKNLALK